MKKNTSKEIPAENVSSNLNYNPSDDIYNKNKLEQNIDPENTDELKQPNEEEEVNENNEIINLDVPGSELDDAQEEIGSEDEENNYYSIGGDGHNDMEEDKE
jgi:hypothetical protein